MMAEWQTFFMITGIFFWGYQVIRAVDYLGVIKARRTGGIYVDMKGTKHNFSPLKDWGKSINEIDAKPVTVKPCDKCKPKKKWERLNAKDDTTDDI